MEALVLFVICVGLIMTSVLILLMIYFMICFLKEIIKLIIRYFRVSKIKKKNKVYREVIKYNFKNQMRELRKPQIYKEVLKDEQFKRRTPF